MSLYSFITRKNLAEGEHDGVEIQHFDERRPRHRHVRLLQGTAESLYVLTAESQYVVLLRIYEWCTADSTAESTAESLHVLHC